MKNILKPILISLIIANLFNLLSANNFAFAWDWQGAAKDLAEGSPIKTSQQIFNILAKILQYVYTAFFIVAIIFILIAAFNFLTAKGDPEKIKGARSQILWAVVAIAIALISVGAAAIINGFLGGQSTGTPPSDNIYDLRQQENQPNTDNIYDFRQP